MAEALICTQCGSHKLKNIGENRYLCDSCGTTTDYNLYNDDTGLKLNIAMTTRQTAKFEEARVLYEQIKSSLNPEQSVPELYFGLFACDYKVLFELDNRTGNRVPIFYSSSESNVFDNPHLKKALVQAKDISFSKFQEYNELANKVETARMLYQKLAKLVTPFDIFICFKKTDLDGISDTRDYSTAMSLYLNLVNKFPKYRIFFSEKTLAEIPLTEYEPNIYYALHTAKILMVVSSKRDYLESQWVKNEWTRFLAINKANAIIPIYLKGSGVNIFPAEILKNNAYEEGDYERIFKSIDAIMNSEKNIKEREQEEENRRKQLIDEVEKRFSKSFSTPNTNLTNMFKRLLNDLSDGIFDGAQKTCDAIFNVDAEHPLAWLYAYLIDKKLKSLGELSTQYESNWVEDRSIRKAIDFSKLEGYESERSKIEDELYKWIQYMVTEAIDLRNRKKYDDAKSKLVKVATHIEEFGRDQRFNYFFQSFLLELSCTNTNDIVSLLGIEKNTNFSKASKYATESQKLQLNEIIKTAKNNATQYQEQIENNNKLLVESLNKLDQVTDEKVMQCQNLIKVAEDDEKEAKLKIKQIEEKNSLDKEQVLRIQEDTKKHKEELLIYYDSFSEKFTRFLYNIRAIVLATSIYALTYSVSPDFIIMSFTYIIPLFILAVSLNFLNIYFHKRRELGRSIKGYVIFGFISGLILLEIPLLIGYSRRQYYTKMDKRINRFDRDLEKVDLQMKELDKKKKDEIKGVKDFIDRRLTYIKKMNETIQSVKSKSVQLRLEHPIFSLDEGIILKVKLEKDINMFKESMVKLDENIYSIAHLEL